MTTSSSSRRVLPGQTVRECNRTLRAGEAGAFEESIGVSGSSGGDGLALSEMGVSAAARGASLPGLGYTVDQAVHD